MLIKTALSKLERYRLSPYNPSYADSEEYQCLATIIDSESVPCWVMGVNSKGNTLTYEGIGERPICIEVTSTRVNIVVHNNLCAFEYKGLYQFYFFDNLLCRNIRLRYRALRQTWLRLKAHFVKSSVNSDKVRSKVICYQKQYLSKNIRCSCVSAEGLAKFTHPWLFEINGRHLKREKLVSAYREALGRLASRGELSGAGDHGLNFLPYDIYDSLHTAAEDSNLGVLRHWQTIVIPIVFYIPITYFCGLMLS